MRLLNNAVLRDRYDVIVVGAGIGGITAAALLAKKGLKVLNIEQHYIPGGICTSFRRQGFTFDAGSTMLFGFGERGFRAHRFVMNELEEEIDIIPQEDTYRLHVLGREITFWKDFEKFFKELAVVFPGQEKELRAFYSFLNGIYSSTVSENEVIVPPSELPRIDFVKRFLKNPAGVVRLAVMMYKTARSVVDKFITDPELISFLDMLTRTFSYSNIEETSALLSASMFIDMHEGGCYYSAGSPQMVPDKVEKALERYGGQMLYRHIVDEILIKNNRAYGVRLAGGTEIMADRVISDATVYNLYGKLVKSEHIRPKRMKWAHDFEPTPSCIIVYIGVDSGAFPADTRRVEIFIPDLNDEEGHGLTMYASSIVDPALAPPGCHGVTAIIVSKDKWPQPGDPDYQSDEYKKRKERIGEEVLDIIERNYPGFREHIKVMEVATPSTIERFTLKNRGCVGGPKQSIGQEMLNRPHARSDWKNLYLCGDSTVMGIGVVAATASGIGAANMVLKDIGMKQFVPKSFPKQYVNYVKGREWTPPPDISMPLTEESAMRLARECQHCENPPCMKACPAGIDVLNFMRRIEAGNFAGAVRSMRQMNPLAEICGYLCPAERLCERVCKRLEFSDEPTRIKLLQRWVCGFMPGGEGREQPDNNRNGKRVAVIGAGPAGLSCAWFLSLAGYTVTVFEKSGEPGGVLSREIPENRLPREVLQREIDGIKKAGIVFKYNSELSKDVELNDLLKEFDGVFLSAGTSQARGEELLALRDNRIDQTISQDMADYLRKQLSYDELLIDPQTLRLKGNAAIFAGGDMIRGSSMVVQSVADGRRAARALEGEIG